MKESWEALFSEMRFFMVGTRFKNMHLLRLAW